MCTLYTALITHDELMFLAKSTTTLLVYALHCFMNKYSLKSLKLAYLLMAEILFVFFCVKIMGLLRVDIRTPKVGSRTP